MFALPLAVVAGGPISCANNPSPPPPDGLETLPTAQASGQPPAAAPRYTQLPADPWPRELALGNDKVTVYQPQPEKRQGNRLDFRMVVALRASRAKDEIFGVV